MLTKIIKNADSIDHSWSGQDILSGESYTITPEEELYFINDGGLDADILSGIAVINDGVSDLNPTEGLEWLKYIEECSKTFFDNSGYYNGVPTNTYSATSVDKAIPEGRIWELNDIPDCDVSSPTDGQSLAFDSSAGVWAPSNQSSTGTGVSIADIKNYYNGENAEDIFEEIGETRGINGYDKIDTNSEPDLSFDAGTRTFSCSVKSGQTSFHFWADSKKIVKTTTQTIVTPNITGTYYIVFDNNGDLIYQTEDSVTLDTFYVKAITALVYWNAVNGTAILSDERHGIRMDSRTHHYNHSTFGARYEGGMDIDGLADGSPSYTGTSLGYFWDEDIRHPVPSLSTHPFIYKLGSTPEWYTTTSDNNVGFKNGGSDIVYNEWSGTEWVLTGSSPSTDFVIYFFFAMGDISGLSVRKIVGQGAYPSQAQAREGIAGEIRKIVTEGLPSPEFVFLYAYIVNRNGSLVDLADGSLYVDLRTSKGGSSSNVTPQYLRLDGLSTMTGNIDAGTQSIINVDLVDGVDVSDHDARHLPDGLDPLPTAIAVNTSNNTNAEGTSNSFSRSNHTHQVSINAPTLGQRVRWSGTNWEAASQLIGYSEEDAVQTTTSNSYQEALRLTVSIPETGNYVITHSLEASNSSKDRGTLIRVIIEDTNIIHEYVHSRQNDKLSPEYYAQGGFKRINLTAGSLIIYLDYKAVSATAAVRRVRLMLTRVD